MTNDPLKIVGAPGSPYSRKLRAVLRYRRIPYAWIQFGSQEARELPQPKVSLLPQLILPTADGGVESRTDSTPLIRELERRYPGRSVIPADPLIAFLDALLEDYADEWLTKAMFHHRWAYDADIENAATLLPRWARTNQPEEEAISFGRMFAERQIERLGVVGSNPATAPIIEASYRRLLRLLDAQLTDSRFVFGDRPAAADFALYGQLTQLTGFDPTPSALARQIAPRVVAWVDIVEDLSGLEPVDDGWQTRESLSPTLIALYGEIGRVYVPFLLANADALARGADRVECTIDGQTWTQRPFPYQGKCLQWLREAYENLTPPDRDAAHALLGGSGCAELFA